MVQISQGDCDAPLDDWWFPSPHDSCADSRWSLEMVTFLLWGYPGWIFFGVRLMMTLWLQAAGSYWEAVGESPIQEIVCLLHDAYLRCFIHSTASSDCVLSDMSPHIYICEVSKIAFAYFFSWEDKWTYTTLHSSYISDKYTWYNRRLLAKHQ